MGVTIAEYLGQRTDIKSPVIEPVLKGAIENCPFMNKSCSKINRKNPQKPICSVRKKGVLWIVCKDRLCSSVKDLPLSDYQKSILIQVAKTIYEEDISFNGVLVRREVKIPNVGSQNLSADYIMRRVDRTKEPNKVVLEMQGGGETSATGTMTRHVCAWEDNLNRSNEMLSQHLREVNPIENNAWKRQSDQFFVKGNVAVQTGGRIVFCVGTLLYDYLWERIRRTPPKDLRKHNWTLAIIAFKEDGRITPVAGAIPLVVDDTRMFFTNYNSFVQCLTNQGDACPEMFQGEFVTLADERFTMS